MPVDCKTITRRQVARLAVALGSGTFLGAIASACGRGGATGAAPIAPKPGAVPVTISFSHWGTESGLGQMNREAARQFMAEYPTIKVDLIFKPSDYYTHLRTMFAGGSPPDVFDISTPYFPAWAREGTMLEVDGYIKRDQGKGFDWNDLWPRHRDSGKYKGKILGVLARVSPFVLYYNPSLFQRAGVKPPDATWGFAEFLDAARKLTAQPGPGGKIDLFGYALVNTHHWIWRNGGDYLVQRGEDKWKPAINTPPVIEAVQLLADLRHKHRVVATTDDLGNPGGMPYAVWFQEGQVAMHDALVARVTDYRANPRMTFDRFDVAHLPKLAGPRATDMDRVVRPIAKPSKHPEEAWLWIKFLLQRPAITAVSMPAVVSWVRSNEFLRPDLPPRNMKVFIEALEYARTVPEHPRWDELNQLISKQLNDAYNGRQSPKLACEQADRDVAAQLQQWGELAQ
jgi:multiple sugar transport system substrate-binding protein